MRKLWIIVLLLSKTVFANVSELPNNLYCFNKHNQIHLSLSVDTLTGIELVNVKILMARNIVTDYDYDEKNRYWNSSTQSFIVKKSYPKKGMEMTFIGVPFGSSRNQLCEECYEMGTLIYQKKLDGRYTIKVRGTIFSAEPSDWHHRTFENCTVEKN